MDRNREDRWVLSWGPIPAGRAGATRTVAPLREPEDLPHARPGVGRPSGTGAFCRQLSEGLCQLVGRLAAIARCTAAVGRGGSAETGPSLVAQTVKHLPTMRETWVQSLGREDLLEKEMATHASILLPGKSHGWRSLVGYSPWGHKESDTIE